MPSTSTSARRRSSSAEDHNLFAKAVLMLTSRGVKDVLWRARAAPSRFREARAGPRRAASAARAAARRRRQARRGEALRRGGRGGRCRTAEARATRGAAATPPTAPARAAAAQAVALPISGASERARARASRRVCPVRRVRHGWRGGGAALCVCYAVARHLLPPTRKTSSRWTADVGLARATRGRLESPPLV